MYNTLLLTLKANYEALKSKLKEPSESIALVTTKRLLASMELLLQQANVKIKYHNFQVADFENAQNCLIDDIWRRILTENSREITSFLKKEKKILRALDEAR